MRDYVTYVRLIVREPKHGIMKYNEYVCRVRNYIISLSSKQKQKSEVK